MAFPVFALGCGPSPQRALPPLLHESGIDQTCGIPPTRILRKQSPVRAPAADTRDSLTPASSFVGFHLRLIR